MTSSRSLSAAAAGDEIAALVLAEEPGRDAHARLGEDLDADTAGERHLGRGEREAAVAEVVRRRDEARGLRRPHELARRPLGGEVDRRSVALLAAEELGEERRLAEVARASRRGGGARRRRAAPCG